MRSDGEDGATRFKLREPYRFVVEPERQAERAPLEVDSRWNIIDIEHRSAEPHPARISRIGVPWGNPNLKAFVYGTGLPRSAVSQ